MRFLGDCCYRVRGLGGEGCRGRNLLDELGDLPFNVDKAIVKAGRRLLHIGELLLQGYDLDGFQR